MGISGPSVGKGGSGASEEVGEDAPIMAEINITPLTDVFLVLLVIFMVTTSVMSQVGVNVQLPTASEKTTQSQPDGVIVSLLPNGRIQINEQEVPEGNLREFERRLTEILKNTPSGLVILEGDKQAFLGAAIEVMDHAKKAGAQKFAIATTVDRKKN